MKVFRLALLTSAMMAGVSMTFAADLAASDPAPQPVEAVAVGNASPMDVMPVDERIDQAFADFSGASVSIISSYNFGKTGLETTDFVFSNDDMNGFGIGLGTGYTFQKDWFLAGINADVSYTGTQVDDVVMVGVPSVPGNTLVGVGSAEMPWLGTLTGKLGAVMPNTPFAVSANGGLALAQVKYTGAAVELDPLGAVVDSGSFAEKELHVGWTVGATASMQVLEKASVDLGYRYVDLGSEAIADTTVSGHPKLHQVNLGFTKRF